MFIIAEIGINHNGDLSIAKQLIDVAIDAGADAVKFQKRRIERVYTKEFLDTPRESPWGSTQRAQKEGLEFGVEQYRQIDSYCREKNIAWFASAWDIDSQHFLRQFELKQIHTQPVSTIASYAFATILQDIHAVVRQNAIEIVDHQVQITAMHGARAVP